MNTKVNEIQSDVKESAEKVWLAGLGALTIASEEGSKLFSTLIEKGSEFDNREKPPVEAVKKTVGSAKERANDVFARFEDAFNDKVASVLQKMGVPTRDEIQSLNERVDRMTDAINKLIDSKTEKEEETVS